MCSYPIRLQDSSLTINLPGRKQTLVMYAQSPPDMPRLTRGEFDWSGGGLTTEVIQNEKLSKF